MARSPSILALAWLSLAPLITAPPAFAQLLSAGRLSAAHGDLEGVRRCTRCHELSKVGTNEPKCLGCHEPLASRLAEERGYHATLAERSCAECHQEHLGRDTPLIELDTAKFDHAAAGFTLAASHGELACRECHQPELVSAADVREFKSRHGALDRTFLGLGTACIDCHATADPHGGQFAGRACSDCHAETTWKEAERFDHDAVDYALTGRHRRVACRECHTPIRERGGQLTLRFAALDYASCTSCHDDAHRGSLGSDCESCHATAGWHRIPRARVEDRFDHSTTSFPLAGRHAGADCAACHQGRRRDEELRLTFSAESRGFAYPLPRAENCLSCHLDQHGGAFQATPGGRVCDNCHDENDWLPATYDIERHNGESDYQLTGGHLAVPCVECHPAPARGAEASQFRVASAECESCHTEDDPHGTQFAGAACRECHDASSFREPRFDHDRARYQLDGAHRDVACESCHVEVENPDGSVSRRYKPLRFECQDCHGEEA